MVVDRRFGRLVLNRDHVRDILLWVDETTDEIRLPKRNSQRKCHGLDSVRELPIISGPMLWKSLPNLHSPLFQSLANDAYSGRNAPLAPSSGWPSWVPATPFCAAPWR